MNYIYIDESGSMTNKHHKAFPYFIIAKVLVNDRKQLKKIFKRFISKNLETLKSLDTNNKMFDGDNFKELKGSCLNKALRISLAKYLCKNNLFKVFFIKINNVESKDNLYESPARAFNYLLGLSFSHHLKKKNITNPTLNLHIDNRNVKVEGLKSLEDYLCTKLSLEENLIENITVSYFDSEYNTLIQLADFFSNLYYSECLTNQYTDLFNELRNSGYFYDEFVFPQKY